MKFHNQHSFMGHEISNVNNKPLLHKKGKQWIVVAVSALILAGFGGMISTNTHADTTNAQPTTTKVAPKPANNSGDVSSAKPVTPKAAQTNTKDIVQQATNLHKNLVNNSINNANNNPKPKITTLGLSSPATLRDNSNIKASGKWTNSTATWTLDNQGNLVVHGDANGSVSVLNHSSDNGHDLAEELGLVGNKATTQSVKTLSFDGNVSAPNDAHRLFDDEEFDNNGTNLKSYDFTNLYQIDLGGLNMSDTHTYWAMFGGLKGLTNVIGFKNLPTDADVQWLFCDDPSLATVDLSQAVNIPNDYWMFLNDPKLQSIILGPKMKIDKNAFINNPSLNNTSENVPSNQQNWTDLNGNHVNINNPKECLTKNTWNAGNTPITVTDTIIYRNKENNAYIPAKGVYGAGDNGYVTGAFGTNPNINWSSYGSQNNSKANNDVAYNWHVVQSNSDLNFKLNNGTQYVYIMPNQITDTVNYSDGNKHIASKQFTGDTSSATGAINTTYDAGVPVGYHATSNTRFTYGTSNNTHTVQVAPDEDYLNYYINVNDMNHNSNIIRSTENSPISINPNTKGVQSNNNSTFTILPDCYSVNLPTGYHIVSGDGISNSANQNDGLTFNYQNGSHKVLIAPNTVIDNIIYKNGSKNAATDTYKGLFNNTFTSIVPAGYHTNTNTNATTMNFTYDGGTHTVNVYPNQITLHFNNDNLGTENISRLTGTTYQIKGSNLPNHYQLANNNSDELNLSDGSDYNIKLVPSKVTDIINYINGNDNVGSKKVNGAYTSNIPNSDITNNIPKGYELVNSNNNLSFNNGSHNVAVTPIQNTDVIDYMNNGVQIASDVYTGPDTKPSFAASYAPTGYHAESTNYQFDGKTYNVNVYPNSITLEFNNGQAGSKTIDNLKGTNYQIKSSDVPANYQLTDPSDDVIDLGNLGKSTDYNVDVSSIQQPVTPPTPSVPSTNVQPSVLYVPSMPSDITPTSSSVSSTSSAANAPASLSAIPTSKASNEAKPTHYRYTKVITPLQLHTSKHFTKKNGVFTIKHPTSFKIIKIVHDHKYTRYEVKYQGHNYFITANDHFTVNNYVQKHDFKSHKHMIVKVIKPMIEYKHAHFNRKYAIRVFKKGAVLPVKKVFTIGKGEMTRFELTNGRFVTSNKLFVKVIK